MHEIKDPQGPWEEARGRDLHPCTLAKELIGAIVYYVTRSLGRALTRATSFNLLEAGIIISENSKIPHDTRYQWENWNADAGGCVTRVPVYF